MKLRNKKTGEIEEFVLFDGNGLRGGATLESLTKEWEDAPEEPKELWAIDQFGEPINVAGLSRLQLEKLRQYGNILATEEEAEKAVEKLKAWHKLMGYWGAEALGWEIRDMPTGGNWQTVNVKFNVKARKEPMELLDILFGGENE